MANRHAAAALSILVFVLAAAAAVPVRAAGGSDLIAAVKNVSSESDKFRSMMSNINANQIHLVNVTNLMSASSESAYKSALKKNASQISDLRDTLNHTTVTGADGVLITLPRLLSRQNLTVDQVVAVSVQGDQITLFYQ